MTSSFGFGVTRHKRLWPKENSFEVGSVFVRLPMRALFQNDVASQVPSRLACGLFGLNKRALLGFSDSDHFEKSKEFIGIYTRNTNRRNW